MRIFQSFLGLEGILVIFRFSGCFGHFLGRGFFGQFLGFGVILLILGFEGISFIFRFMWYFGFGDISVIF